jgi:predicted MFS family arabinose efflux permease
MLTPSVNIVQSSFPEKMQGEISGLSRSVSNLGSSFGTAIAGTILISDFASGNAAYALATGALAVLALIGLAAALRLLQSRRCRRVRESDRPLQTSRAARSRIQRGDAFED